MRGKGAVVGRRTPRSHPSPRRTGEHARGSISLMPPPDSHAAAPAAQASRPLLAGRKGLIMGVANERSLAWGIARATAAHGAELAFTYQGGALEKRVRPLAESVGSGLVFPCDVGEEDSLAAAFDSLERTWGKLDFAVHAIAWSDKDQLKGRYVDTSRENFYTLPRYLLLLIHGRLPPCARLDA